MYLYIDMLITDNGLDDIKYNFLIDDQGVIYEGRGWGFVGQHTVGMNAMSIGRSFLLPYIREIHV